jgi:hypothetical protein
MAYTLRARPTSRTRTPPKATIVTIALSPVPRLGNGIKLNLTGNAGNDVVGSLIEYKIFARESQGQLPQTMSRIIEVLHSIDPDRAAMGILPEDV